MAGIIIPAAHLCLCVAFSLFVIRSSYELSKWVLCGLPGLALASALWVIQIIDGFILYRLGQ